MESCSWRNLWRRYFAGLDIRSRSLGLRLKPEEAEEEEEKEEADEVELQELLESEREKLRLKSSERGDDGTSISRVSTLSASQQTRRNFFFCALALLMVPQPIFWSRSPQIWKSFG